MTTIANTSTPSVQFAPASFDVLLEKMMPHFRYFAKQFIRRYGRRYEFDDVMQDLIGMALDKYRSLVQRGKEVFYSPIVNYTIKHYRYGRRLTGYNSTDIHSEETQRLGRSDLCQLSTFDSEDRTKELDCREFMEDRRVSIFDTVQFTVDFEDWVAQQAPRDQQIITDLSYGESTGSVARKYRVSDGLISQYRKRYRTSWDSFIDPPEAGMAVLA
jgi:DNA-directed RNA polymerase specialized sigma24 family protein